MPGTCAGTREKDETGSRSRLHHIARGAKRYPARARRQAVGTWRAISVAVTSECDAFHTGAPRRKTITCGDSCRTPTRAAICCDRERCARTSTRKNRTSKRCSAKVSTSSRADRQRGQVGLCLYSTAVSERNSRSTSSSVAILSICAPPVRLRCGFRSRIFARAVELFFWQRTVPADATVPEWGWRRQPPLRFASRPASDTNAARFASGGSRERRPGGADRAAVA
jgi:hypothetical protein